MPAIHVTPDLVSRGLYLLLAKQGIYCLQIYNKCQTTDAGLEVTSEIYVQIPHHDEIIVRSWNEEGMTNLKTFTAIHEAAQFIVIEVDK